MSANEGIDRRGARSEVVCEKEGEYGQVETEWGAGWTGMEIRDVVTPLFLGPARPGGLGAFGVEANSSAFTADIRIRKRE